MRCCGLGEIFDIGLRIVGLWQIVLSRVCDRRVIVGPWPRDRESLGDSSSLLREWGWSGAGKALLVRGRDVRVVAVDGRLSTVHFGWWRFSRRADKVSNDHKYLTDLGVQP